MKTKIVLTSIIAVAFSSLAHAAEPDIDKGKKVFRKCKACHEVMNEKNKVGPHLVNVIGRQAGSMEGYKYSKAMKAKGADENLVWNEETLDLYLTKPRTYVKGTKMAFPGLKKEADRQNVIAYLKTFSKTE